LGKSVRRGFETQLSIVMAGHSRLKDGVASARLRPAIHDFLSRQPKNADARDKPGHDDNRGFV
jgi:hypothetical protein